MSTLSDLFAEARKSPEYQRAYDEMRNARSVPCNYGNCSVLISAATGRIIGGFGRPGCACDNTPGWNAKHLAQMGKPGWSGKVRGRNGSRVQRSRRRHKNVGPNGIMVWMQDFYE